MTGPPRGEPLRRRIEAGALRKFARATGQTDPLFTGGKADDAEGITASPTYVGTFCNDALVGVFLPRPEHDMILHTADEVDLFAPIRVGDTIAAVAELELVEEHVGRHGPTTVQRARITLTNQRGEPVATIGVEMRSFSTGQADD